MVDSEMICLNNVIQHPLSGQKFAGKYWPWILSTWNKQVLTGHVPSRHFKIPLGQFILMTPRCMPYRCLWKTSAIEKFWFELCSKIPGYFSFNATAYYILPKTTVAPENRPSQKDISSYNHEFSGARRYFHRGYTVCIAAITNTHLQNCIGMAMKKRNPYQPACQTYIIMQARRSSVRREETTETIPMGAYRF